MKSLSYSAIFALLSISSATPAFASKLSEAFRACVNTGEVQRTPLEGSDRSSISLNCYGEVAKHLFAALYDYDNHCDQSDSTREDGSQLRQRLIGESDTDANYQSLCQARISDPDGNLVEDGYACFINLSIRRGLMSDIL